MASDEKDRQQGLGPLGIAAVAAALLIFAIAALWLRQNPAGRTDLETDRAKERLERLAKLRESETKALGEYTWIDRGAGVVGLPIERAIELELPRLSAKPIRPGPLIPPPAPTNAPPTGTTNAPPAAPSAGPTNPPPASPPAPATPQLGPNNPPPAPQGGQA